MTASRQPAACIAVDARATLGEGPVWDEQQQRLLWVDISPGLVHRFDPATGSDAVLRVGKPVGSAGLRHGGGLVLAVEDGFALLDPGWQRLDQVAVIEHSGPPARWCARRPRRASASRPAACWRGLRSRRRCPRAARSAVRRLMLPMGRRRADGNH